MPLAGITEQAQHEGMTRPRPEYDDYQSWRDLQDVLEERDREWWAEAENGDDGDE